MEIVGSVAPWRALWFLVSNTLLLGIDWLPRVLPLEAPHTAVLVAPAWTLGIELSFYTVATLLLRRSSWILAAVLIASVTLRLAYFIGLDIGGQPWGYNFFPFELALFMAGALSYRLCERVRDHSTGGAIFGLSLIVVVLLFQVIQKGITVSICNCDPTVVPLRITFYAYATFAIAFLFRETRNNRIDAEFGDLSYPLYLAHYPLIDLYNALFQPEPTLVHASVRSLVVLFVSLLAAVLIRRLVERPIDAARHRRYRELAILQRA